MSTNSEKTDGKKNRRIFYIILIIVLLVINALLFYNNLQTRGERDEAIETSEQLESEKIELTEQNKELIGEIDALNAELESQKGQNAELDAEIERMQAELAQKKQEYLRNIRSKENENSQLRKELQLAREEFETIKNEYLEQIDSLVIVQQILRDTLSGREENIRTLESTVKKGQVLSANAVNSYGIRYKSNNKEVETDNYKKVERIKVCFKIAENRITEPGFKPILVKITSPEGTTLALESMGSGSFELENGEESLYTKKININYDPSNPDKEFCTDWQQNTPFQEGEYKVELYHNGFKIGQDSFTLEKGGLF